MEAHKRILGILFIISGAIEILLLIFVSTLLSALFPMIFDRADVDEQWVLVWIVPFIRTLATIIIILISIPSIVGGVGILKQKKWALTLVLILGCFKLFSFPVGTALGIYTIWVYTEDHRRNRTSNSN